MKTLAEWNDELDAAARKRGENPFESLLNGIACSACGAELYDTEYGVTIFTGRYGTRVEKGVHCVFCGFHGRRLVKLV